MFRIQFKFRYLAASVCLFAISSMIFAFVGNIDSNACDCTENVATLSQASCCDMPQTSTGCCIKEVAKKNPCCCNPEAAECQCSDCSCSETNDSPAPTKSTPPSQQSVELVLIGVVGPAAQFSTAWSQDNSGRPRIGSQLEDMPTSHQKCVILSRFNC